MAFGSFSANGQGWVTVLLKIWHETSALELVGLWVGLGLSVEMEPFGRALSQWGQDFSGGPKSWTWSLLPRGSGLTPCVSEDFTGHTAQKKKLQD